MTQQRDIPELVETLQDNPDNGDFIEPLLNFRRRMTIRYISNLPTDAAVGTRELATVITAAELDISVNEVENSDYRRTYEGLNQRDITRLVLNDILDKHDKTEIVRGDQFEFYAGILDAMDEYMRNSN
jgi:hypothetical protein